MKLQDLFEYQKVFSGDIRLPSETTKLDFRGATVKGDFRCDYTKIKSLEGAPSRVEGYFTCSGNTGITSLKGAPSWVGINFYCFRTNIKSLHNIHKIIKHIGDGLLLPETIESHILGVMMIKGLKEIQFHGGLIKQLQLTGIINKHLQGDRDIHACQEEMLEAGFAEYAKL